jgi:hypothetical protein
VFGSIGNSEAETRVTEVLASEEGSSLSGVVVEIGDGVKHFNRKNRHSLLRLGDRRETRPPD